MARNRYFVSAPFDAGLNVMPHPASRRSLLSAVRSSSSRRRLAQQYTSSLVIPCAHGKLNVKHHRTTSKPVVHTSVQQRKKLRWPENSIEHQNVHRRRSSSSSAGIYIRVCKRGRFPQTRDLWRKSASMGYRVGRVHCTPSRGGRGRQAAVDVFRGCLLYTSPSPRDRQKSRMPSSA